MVRKIIPKVQQAAAFTEAEAEAEAAVRREAVIRELEELARVGGQQERAEFLTELEVWNDRRRVISAD